MRAVLSLLCLLHLLYPQGAFSCAWIKGTKYNGSRVRAEGFSAAFMLRRALAGGEKPDAARMEAELRSAKSFDQRSDYAVALMYLGRSKEAVEILDQLEKEKPGEYFIAANLGTAHELAGNNQAALRWITEGIRRDPDSHSGTEWLHVKILEAKIAHTKDPSYFEKHSVLNLNPDQLGGSVAIDGQSRSPKQVAEAIKYQLKERLQFVKPPDPAVASLLFDYAAIEAATKTLESARDLLRMAVEYGYPSAKVTPLIRLYDRRIFWGKTRHYAKYTLIGLGAVGLIGWIMIWQRRRGDGRKGRVLRPDGHQSLT